MKSSGGWWCNSHQLNCFTEDTRDLVGAVANRDFVTNFHFVSSIAHSGDGELYVEVLLDFFCRGFLA